MLLSYHIWCQLVLGCRPEARHSARLGDLVPRLVSVSDSEMGMAENGPAMGDHSACSLIPRNQPAHSHCAYNHLHVRGTLTTPVSNIPKVTV